MNSSQRLGEFAGSVTVPGIGPDIDIADLTAYVHNAEEGGYWAEVPMLPGCLTQGETMDEVVENLHDAIEGWLSAQTLDSLSAKGVPFSLVSTSKSSLVRYPRVQVLEFAA